MNLVFYKAVMAERGLRQWQVARSLEWHATKLSAIVNGHYGVKLKDAEKICAVLDVPLSDLFPEFSRRRTRKADLT